MALKAVATSSLTIAPQTIDGSALAPNTSGDGLVLQNNTPATAGNQSFSPRIRLTGQGWKTNAVAASQEVDWIIENEPVQGAAAPLGNLVFSAQIAGGGYTQIMSLTNASVLSCGSAGSVLSFGRLQVIGSNIATNGVYLPAANTLGFSTNSIAVGQFSSTGRFSLLTEGLSIHEGVNFRMGTAVLSAGSVVVPNTSITANTRVFITDVTLGTITAPVAYSCTARVAGTSFTITSQNVADTSTVCWLLIEPN